MVLELHVWGPAFGLPSIDAHCLAAIAYLRQCLPSEAWVLVPSNPSISPFNELPALKAGDLWVAGYNKIVGYLHDFSHGDWDLDKDLSPSERADATAMASFLESRGQPLLDLSLFVSSENYTTCTRPALAEILSWPDSWFLPHRLRDRAKKRSEHLGLTGLDVDTAQDDKSKEDGLTGQIPKSLTKPKQTVSSILGRDVRKNRFRLDAVTSDFLDPLEEMLEDKKWLFGDQPRSIDCQAVGLLALLQGPKDLPHGWIKEAINAKYRRLGDWALRNSAELFGKPVPTITLFKSDKDLADADLPWQLPAARSWQAVVNAALQNSIEAVPVLRSALSEPEIRRPADAQSADQYHQKHLAVSRIQGQRLHHSQIIGSSILTAVVAGTLYWNGLFSMPLRMHRTNSRSFGEAGILLGLG